MAVAKQVLRDLVERNDNRDAASGVGAQLLSRRGSGGCPDLVLPNLVARLEPETGILWAEMQHGERACFTPELMRDGRAFQQHLKRLYAGFEAHEMPFRYLAWTSRAKGVWSLGGDLATFTRLIRTRNREGLRRYAHASIDVLYDNYRSLDLPILTVAVIEGDAVGGGFEAMVTNDIVIAERGTKFGLPEILFNLFPGMGAYSFLRRRVGEIEARRLIEDGRTRSAEELHALGLVDRLVERGEARAALRAYAEERAARFRTELVLKKMRHRVEPVTRSELVDVVELWVELALELSEADLRRMDALARHQERRAARAA
ncbi:putative enoyl-CoA hydratase echA8 [bacterium HR40]|nr:putative enoyl-CoA hydratase echA8 [bacterium HR40]